MGVALGRQTVSIGTTRRTMRRTGETYCRPQVGTWFTLQTSSSRYLIQATGNVVKRVGVALRRVSNVVCRTAGTCRLAGRRRLTGKPTVVSTCRRRRASMMSGDGWSPTVVSTCRRSRATRHKRL